MIFLPEDFSLYILIKDCLWTISIIIGVASNIINIHKNNEIARQKRLMEKSNSEKGFYPLKMFRTIFIHRNKKLPQRYIDIIAHINNDIPEIYYDNGYFNVGWNWFIKNSVIILIEKNIFKYTFRVWKEFNGKWDWSEKKKIVDLERDQDLKDRILFIKNRKE